MSWTGSVRIISQLKDGKDIRTTGYAISCCIGHLVRVARVDVGLTWRSGSGRSDEEQNGCKMSLLLYTTVRICIASQHHSFVIDFDRIKSIENFHR